ncbi:MAG TPA: hypothetical protein VF932_00125 [Anaerolineae bacterium]
MIFYAVAVSLGFGGLYGGTAFAHTESPEAALTAGALAGIAFAVSFLMPPVFFRYSNGDTAPRVMSQVLGSAMTASLVVLAANAAVWVVVARPDIGLLEELYVYALIGILLFHGLGGAIASHVVYLQQTRQYNSNQLVAVLVLVTLILLVLILYFLAFDFAIPRDAYIHVRDLATITLVLIAYGRAIYRMAHH